MACSPTTQERVLATIAAATLLASVLMFVPAAQAQNQPPIADAGPDEVFPVGVAQRLLQGFRSFDIDDDVSQLTFRWTVVTPSYSWLPFTLGGQPHGSQATYLAPAQTEINRYGNTITFRLTVTDSAGNVSTDNVTHRFEGPPSVAVAVTALRPGPRAEDLDRDDCEDQDADFSVNAIIAGPNQAGNAANEWDIKEGACLTLRGIGTLASGATGVLRYRWQKISAVPNRSDYNVPATNLNSQTFSVLIPDDFDAGRGAILHYTLTVTSPTGVAAQSTVRINVVDEPSNPTVSLELLDTRQPVQDANALEPDAATLRYVVEPGVSVNLVALGDDPDANQARGLAHAWSGPGVEQTSADRPGSSSRATITIPANAPIGQSLTATVVVTDSTNRSAQDQITFTVAVNRPPEAIAPRNFATEDGPFGGTNRRGTVYVRGGGTDPDGSSLLYRWFQVDSSREPLKKPTVDLMNANTDTVSFAAPSVSINAEREIHLALTVADRWGVGDTDYVTVTILGANDRPVADAGPNQIVQPGAEVRLDGSASFDPDPGTFLRWSWAFTGLATSPPQNERPLTPFQRDVALRGFVPDGTDYSGLMPLLGASTPRPIFTAPQLGGLDSVQLTFTLTVDDRTGGRNSDTVTVTVTGQFFSGPVIDGPDFCTNHSLGGARTYAFDSNNDGVADICSLPYTRREAVARQNALVTLALLDQPRFRAAVLDACDDLTGGYGDHPDDLDSDVCETRRVAEPPPPIDPVVAGQFFSGPVIDGPDFCTNHSLGGARTYAFDSDNDGVADICSLPYTRREAVARQNALETFTTPRNVYDSSVAQACRQLGSTTFEGDSAAAMARDACA